MKKTKYENLVFEGGGVKGIAYIGALEALPDKLLSNIKRVAGSSAGAIVACLLAVGYTPPELNSIWSTLNFSDFADSNRGFIRDLFRFFKGYGWHKGAKLSEFVQDLIERKTGVRELTFLQLFLKHKAADPDQSKGISHSVCKELYVTGTNLNTQREEVFSHLTTPHMPIWKAVRISMSIPLFFQSVEYEGDRYVDGGMSWNYPIDLFDNQAFFGKHTADQSDYYQYGKSIFNKLTLGFRLDSEREIKKKILDRLEIKNVHQFLYALSQFFFTRLNASHDTSPDNHKRTVVINTGSVRATSLDIIKEQKLNLFYSGQIATIKFFNNGKAIGLERQLGN